MSIVHLLDYIDDKIVHNFDYKKHKIFEATEIIRNPLLVGYFAWKKVGLSKRKVIPVAFYLRESKLILAVADMEIEIINGVKGKVCKKIPLIRKFNIFQNGTNPISLVYWHCSGRVWPDDGDIFSSVERASVSEESILRTIEVWKKNLNKII